MQNGEMKVQIVLSIEGPPQEVTEKLVEVLKVMPRKLQLQAARQFQKKVREELGRARAARKT